MGKARGKSTGNRGGAGAGKPAGKRAAPEGQGGEGGVSEGEVAADPIAGGGDDAGGVGGGDAVVGHGAVIRSISDLVADDRNANRGTLRGAALIERSLKELGAGRSVLADKNGKLIAGNKTVAGAIAAGMTRVRVVETDGDELVVVQRRDLDLDQDKAARELALVDNRAGQLSLEWDPEVIASLGTDYGLELNALGFTGKELDALAAANKPREAGDPDPAPAQQALEDKYEVVVECRSEEEQRAVFEKLTSDGLACRVLTV